MQPHFNQTSFLNGENIHWITLRVNEVSLEAGPYCMSYAFDPNLLRNSMERRGLLNPPFVIRDNAGVLNVVVGYRRIIAARDLGWKEVLCRDISKMELSSVECLLLNLYDNLPTRSFNEVEKGMILKRLLRHVSRTEVVRKYMPLLGLVLHEQTLDAYIGLENLEESIKHALAQGPLSLHAAKVLLEMDPYSRTTTFKFISELKLNGNYQKQLLEYLIDILEIEGKAPSQVLSEELFANILHDQNLNNPQRGKALLGALRSRRNPRLTASEKEFEQMVSRLSLPHAVQISHSPFFEKPVFTLTISFHEGKALKNKIIELSKIEGWENIHSPLVNVK